MVRGIILISFIGILFACTSKDPVEGTTPTTLREVKVNVETTTNGMALSEVEIVVYKTEDDRLDQKNEVSLGKTDSLGKLSLSYYVSIHDSSYYHYVRATHPYMEKSSTR